MERKLMIAPSMGCCDLFDMERQVRIIDEKSDFLHMDIKRWCIVYQALESDQNF